MSEDEKQLLGFCTASVELYARSIIDPGTVNAENIQTEMQSFASKMDRSKAVNVGKILFSLELQYRNAAVYERFTTARKKIEDAVDQVHTATQAAKDAGDGPLSVADLQSHANLHADIANYVVDVMKYYKSCFPLRHRVRYAPVRLALSPICSYKTNEFEINAANEYILVEKQRLLWKVQVRDKEKGTGTGPEILVPSVFFFIHWLPDDAIAIQRLLSRVREAQAVYVAALAAHFRRMSQQPKFRVIFTGALLKELSALFKLPDEPSHLTGAAASALQDELTTYLQRTRYPDLPEQEKPVVASLSAISAALKTYLSVPETVADRSQVVFSRRLRIDGQKENRAETDKLVHVEWKMELNLNKCITTTETTEIIPKQVDVDRFKQTEQETERKMVIQAVVDPTTDKEISLNEAVQRGIVDYSSGTYCNLVKGESMTIDEAIMKGHIQVEFVAVQAGEEKQKSYGIVSVKDPASNTEEHYVVHVAVDRKSNERLEFDQAVERQILNLENGWFWDSMESEALPISDAITKGYLKGRKVDNPNELSDLAKTQADVVKMRIKKVTATMGLLKNFRASRASTATNVLTSANGTNGTNGAANGNGTQNGTNGNGVHV